MCFRARERERERQSRACAKIKDAGTKRAGNKGSLMRTKKGTSKAKGVFSCEWIFALVCRTTGFWASAKYRTHTLNWSTAGIAALGAIDIRASRNSVPVSANLRCSRINLIFFHSVNSLNGFYLGVGAPFNPPPSPPRAGDKAAISR